MIYVHGERLLLVALVPFTESASYFLAMNADRFSTLCSYNLRSGLWFHQPVETTGQRKFRSCGIDTDMIQADQFPNDYKLAGSRLLLQPTNNARPCIWGFPRLWIRDCSEYDS